MSRPFFMHIHIHSQTQRSTIRSKSGVLLVHSLIVLFCSSGWQRPTERGEGMAQESTGSERTHGSAAWIIVKKEDLSFLA